VSRIKTWQWVYWVTLPTLLICYLGYKGRWDKVSAEEIFSCWLLAIALSVGGSWWREKQYDFFRKRKEKGGSRD
jgi:hypothetical protein